MGKLRKLILFLFNVFIVMLPSGFMVTLGRVRFLSAENSDRTAESTGLPSYSRHKISQYKTHTNLLSNMQRSSKFKHCESVIMLDTNWLVICDLSLGGPGRNDDEQIEENSTFGTMCPSFGLSTFGATSSPLIPHTTHVFPSFTTDDESAVEIEPISIFISLDSQSPRWSGLRFNFRNLRKYSIGWIVLNSSAMF